MKKNDGYLIHHGILGMKWGKRNGPPYPLDASDHSAAEKAAAKENSGSPGAKWFSDSVKQGKDKPNISRAESVAKNTKNIIDSSRDIASDVEKMKSKTAPKKDYSNMTDAELQARVNRLRLEREMRGLESEQQSGKVYASDVLTLAGNVASIGVSAATLFAIIYKLKH